VHITKSNSLLNYHTTTMVMLNCQIFETNNTVFLVVRRMIQNLFSTFVIIVLFI
jgi:hypothetical protein